MKKLLITLLAMTMILSCTGCGNKKEKYPYEHIGIYDTKTQQYIDIGDSKNKVDKILGLCSENEYGSYDYDDILSIRFDDDNKVEHISVYFDWFPDEGENERYTLADGTNYNSTVTEFINKYNHVYEGDRFSDDDHAISVILQNKNNKIVMPTIDDVKNSTQMTTWEETENIDDMYIISIDYFAYDNLSSFTIDKVTYPLFEDWDNFTEIEK